MKLSIITINYNNCEGLRKTIESVVNQTWKEFEWIIVDGGSTDGSKELIEETAHQLETKGWYIENFSLYGFTAEGMKNGTYTFPSSIGSNAPFPFIRGNRERFLKWTSEKDKGIYNAMNKGIVIAKGEYCLFLNSGDYLYKDVSMFQVSSSLNSYDLIICDMLCNGRKVQSMENVILTLSYFRTHTLPHQSTFIKKELLQRCGLYDESFKIVSDNKFFIEASIYRNATYKYVPVSISVFEGGGISSDDETPLLKQERKRINETYFPERLCLDFNASDSYYEVNKNWFCSKLYALLYRLVICLNKL